MPLHQNEDGTWQWGKSGKKYKKKEDAIKQMKAIFASGYREGQSKKASYVEALNLIKQAAPNMKQIAARQRALAQINHTFPSIPKPDEAPYNRLSPEGYKRALDRVQAKAKQEFNPISRFQYSSKPGSYKDNLNKARYNALARVESSGNPYSVSEPDTAGRRAVGAFQIRPIALTQAIKKGWVPKNTTQEDILKKPQLGKLIGSNYLDMVRPPEAQPEQEYAFYSQGPYAYKKGLNNGKIKAGTSRLGWARQVKNADKYKKYLQEQIRSIPAASK